MERRNKWSRVSVLTALLDEVDILIGNKPQLGYPSMSSFVNDAVRRLLEKYRTSEQEAGENRRSISLITRASRKRNIQTM